LRCFSAADSIESQSHSSIEGTKHHSAHDESVITAWDINDPVFLTNSTDAGWPVIQGGELRQTIEQIPALVPEGGHIPPENVNVTVNCLENGLQVIFKTGGQNYTGSVYAAERFSQCHVLVKQSSEFSLFVPRPLDVNPCNAIEINDTLTVVIVMSNDRVTPLDVTTKDDLFYDIKCVYRNQDEDIEQSVNVHSGLVISGPDPKSIVSSYSRRSFSQQAHVVLKITKNDRPVENVVIGDELTAVIESDVERKHFELDFSLSYSSFCRPRKMDELNLFVVKSKCIQK
uniref:ZP domain-containing protein n=1 Tax=Anisakis simplex TaxID=6269 RepID=A0A0M3KGM9_ANISI